MATTEKETREQHMILDHTIFQADSNAIESFKPRSKNTTNHLYIPIWVLERLEHLMEDSTESGRNARATLFRVDQLMSSKADSSSEGIPIGKSNKYFLHLYADTSFDTEAITPPKGNLKILHNDSDSLSVKLALKLMKEQKTVEYITNSASWRIKAKSLGINASPWQDVTPISTIDELYKGWRVVKCDGDIIEKFNHSPDAVIDPAKIGVTRCWPNEYFLLNGYKGSTSETYGIFKKKVGGIVHLVNFTNGDKILSPKNYLQRFLMDALRDYDIRKIIAIGWAGTGKTILELEAGLVQTIPHLMTKRNNPYFDQFGIKPFKNIAVLRSVIGLSDDEQVGFMPGDPEQKIEPYKAPIIENIEAILEKAPRMPADERVYSEKNPIYQAVKFGILYFVRGRTFRNQFVIIEEAQNLSISKMKAIVGRMGEGTKMAINGDISQLDADCGFSNNGLIKLNESHKESPHAATIYFPPEFCVRDKYTLESLMLMEKKQRRD